MKGLIRQAVDELKSGKFVLVYDSDSREGETDFIKAAQFAEPADVHQMRTDGGGLVILVVADEYHNKLGLPFMVDVYAAAKDAHPLLGNLNPSDIPYDAKSSFSLTINHRKTFTGITDDDRALTLKEFARVCRESEKLEREEARTLLGENFRSPGHVYVCNASAAPLEERFGHTEYGVALLTIAGLTPVGTACEMMGDDGKALKKEEAKRYAEIHNLTYVEGKDIVDAWRERK